MAETDNADNNNTYQTWEEFYDQSDAEFEREKANYIKMEEDRGKIPNAYLLPGKDDTPENFYNVWQTNASAAHWNTEEFIREDYRGKIDKQPPEEEFTRGLSLCVRKFNPPLFWLDQLGGDNYLTIYGVRYLYIGIARITTLKQNGKLIISLYYWRHRRGSINRRNHRDLFLDFARHLFEWLKEDWEVETPQELIETLPEPTVLPRIENIEPKQLEAPAIKWTEQEKELKRKLILGMLDRELEYSRGYKHKFFVVNKTIARVIESYGLELPYDLKTIRGYRGIASDFLEDSDDNTQKRTLGPQKYNLMSDEVKETVKKMKKVITENGNPWETDTENGN